MNETEPIIWKRRDRLRVRALCRADLAALSWLLDDVSRPLRTLEAPPGADERRRLLEAAPRMQLALERDQQLIGAALASLQSTAPETTPHPWTALEKLPGDAEALQGEDAAHLRGMGLFWRDVLDESDVREVLALCRKALVQRFGCASIYSVVEATGFDNWRETLAPAAYIQQVHAGSVADPVLGVWIEQGWSLWGWKEVEGAIEVVVAWENRAR